MADRVGQQLGNYRLIRLLGQGGFAMVYLGRHIHLDTYAAIKVLHSQLENEDIEHLRVEARTIARLVHPHIVRVLEFQVEDNTPFLVVDYAPNGTLRKRHPRGSTLPLATVVSYTTQVAEALQYAHDQRVIHRDVKPENMLLGRDNEVLLSDFGIAVVAQSSRRQSTQGLQDLAGTVAYMAPEQIQAHASPGSDQYALGIVVYEWLSGERPFHGTFTEIAVKHTLATPPPLRLRLPTLSRDVEEVVMTAIAKDPKDRFPNIRAFASALEEASKREPSTSVSLAMNATQAELPDVGMETMLLTDEKATPHLTFSNSVVPETPSTSLLPDEELQHDLKTPALTPSQLLTTPPSAPQRIISRRAATILLTGAAIAVVGGVAWLTLLQEKPGTPPAPFVDEGAVVYTYTGHTDWVWTVAWSPKALRIASASGDTTVQVWDATSGDHLTLYKGHTGPAYAVAWSPNGTRIASASNDKTVQVWDANFGDHFLTYQGHTAWVWTVAWSPDGRRIASGGGDNTVQVWDATNGASILTYRGHAGPIHGIAWSPNSQYIASASGDGTVQVWDAALGSHIYTYRPNFTVMWSVAWSPDGIRIASASDNRTVQVWNALNGDHPYTYRSHTDFVYSAAWSPDSKRIASGGDDKTVRVWNATNGSQAYIYQGHASAVRSVSWSPDGKYIASGSWDKTVQVWQAT